MKCVKFKEDFKKLNKEYFSSIRKASKKLKSREIYLIKSPSKEFKAMLIVQTSLKLCDMPTELLVNDTETENKKGAIKKLREFYPTLKETDDVHLFYFKRIGTQGE